jgi:ribosomal protein L29
MAILKLEEIKKMPEKEMQEKLRDLKIELVRAGVSKEKGKMKTKEIKRTIARILTFNRLNKKSIEK